MNYTREIWETSFLYVFLNDKMYGSKTPMTCESLLKRQKVNLFKKLNLKNVKK